MTTQIMDGARNALHPFAWPGGYPVMYLARDGWREENGKLDVNEHDPSVNTCCAKCAQDTAQWPDLIVVASYIHWEGDAEVCEYCSGETPSAYGAGL